jgi:hypothetical protein
MQRGLLDELIDKPQRETAGADTSARFDYQRNWAFCEMLRRHLANADYLVAFEFHDDTVFLSPGAAPTSAEFFQVKTSKSTIARKLADLTSRRLTIDLSPPPNKNSRVFRPGHPKLSA